MCEAYKQTYIDIFMNTRLIHTLLYFCVRVTRLHVDVRLSSHSSCFFCMMVLAGLSESE